MSLSGNYYIINLTMFSFALFYESYFKASISLSYGLATCNSFYLNLSVRLLMAKTNSPYAIFANSSRQCIYVWLVLILSKR